MSPLPRGFKTWTEHLSAGIRRELGLPPTAPLPQVRLAEYLGVRLLTPRDIPGMPAEVLAQLLDHDPSGWSAVTQEVDGSTVVIHNSRHSPARQASNIAHELAHILLEHVPGRVIVSPDGSVVMRSYDAEQEEEANWLAWALLLPRVALLHATRAGSDVASLAEEYGVSVPLVQFRMKICGVGAQLRSTRARVRKATGPPRK